MRVMFVTPSLSDNSLGRTYCLDLLVDALGWKSEIWAADGDAVWGPLRADPFAQRCFRAKGGEADVLRRLSEVARRSDLLIAVKPLVHSLGLAHQVHLETGVPIIADVDDPDLEVLVAEGQPVKALAKRLLKPKAFAAARSMRRLLSTMPRMVSNPELQRRYGGVLVPHVRAPMTPTAGRETAHSGIRVAFVGSVQPHKGIDVLRAALRLLAQDGYHLVATADAPDDVQPHESWVGRTSLQEGLDIVADADVVVVPSLATPWSRGQLPVKVVDAMLLGTCVIVSDIAPLPWAVGGGGIVVPPGDVQRLAAALRALGSASERRRRADELVSLANDRYTVEANRLRFESICRDALRTDT